MILHNCILHWRETSCLGIFTVRKKVAKVMFLHLCVCPQGVCLNACWDTTPLPEQAHPRADSLGAGTPPGTDPPGADPWEQAPPPEQVPPRAGTTQKQAPPRSRHLPSSRRLLLRMVRILLECILVPLCLSTALILADFLRAMRTAEIWNNHSIPLISSQKVKFTELRVEWVSDEGSEYFRIGLTLPQLQTLDSYLARTEWIENKPISCPIKWSLS